VSADGVITDPPADPPPGSPGAGVAVPAPPAGVGPAPPAAKHAHHFDTKHLMGDLHGRSVRGGAVTLIGQTGKFALQIGSTAILARLLTPDDFGLIAMVIAITGLAAIFKDAGLSMATVQRKDVTHEQVSALFWLNLGLSSVVMLVVAGASPAIAWFYDEPKLIAITLAIATTFLVGGLTVQHQALIRRQMRFKQLAMMELQAFAFGIAVAIAMAVLGAGYWSLVGQAVGQAVAHCVLAWVYCSWRPGRLSRAEGVGSMLAFSGNLTAFNVVNYFTRNADNMMIGAVWGAGSLGIYSKAYGLLLLPLRQIAAPISAATLPALSRLQDDPAGFREFYCYMVRLLSFVTMPMVIMLAVLADEVVLVVLGPQWEQAATIFRVLAFIGLIQSVSTTTGWVLTALGRTKRMLQWSFIGTPSILIAFAIGLHWGALGVAVGALILSVLIVTPQMFFNFYNTPVRVRDITAAVAAPFVLSLVMFAVCEPVRLMLSEQHALLRVASVSVVAAVVALAGYAVLPGVRRDVKDAVGLIMRRKKPALLERAQRSVQPDASPDAPKPAGDRSDESPTDDHVGGVSSSEPDSDPNGRPTESTHGAR
jgi:PST family polysaccharide transporter